MIGYIFDSSRKITMKISNILKCNDTILLGDKGTLNSNITAILGTGQYIITDQVFNEGDILPSGIVDQRASVPVLTA